VTASRVGNAGHLPPLLLSDTPPRLNTTAAGPRWAGPARQQYQFSLPPGKTAVLYSDGLVENRRRGRGKGLDKLVAVASQVPPGQQRIQDDCWVISQIGCWPATSWMTT
jgi:serine phosphatase RsbU (regulator of sigma subunit)